MDVRRLLTWRFWMRYYNFLFILADHQEGDKFKLEWLKERIKNGDRMNYAGIVPVVPGT